MTKTNNAPTHCLMSRFEDIKPWIWRHEGGGAGRGGSRGGGRALIPPYIGEGAVAALLHESSTETPAFSFEVYNRESTYLICLYLAK